MKTKQLKPGIELVMVDVNDVMEKLVDSPPFGIAIKKTIIPRDLEFIKRFGKVEITPENGFELLGTFPDFAKSEGAEEKAREWVEWAQEKGQFEYPSGRPFKLYMDYDLGCYGDNDFTALKSLRSAIPCGDDELGNVLLIIKKDGKNG